MALNQTGKSLVVGAAGMVGHQMLSALGAAGLGSSRRPRSDWIELDLESIEEQSQVAARLDCQDLNAIYCVGGMTHVDGCEAEPELAWKINSRGPGVLARYAQSRALPFVYFSTEYVFDGSPDAPGPYVETSPSNPISVYGRTKLEGEQRVLAESPEAVIIRTTVVYGPDPGGKNFVYTLVKHLSSGVAMRVPEDQVSTPTYNRDLVRATLRLVHTGRSGVFHVCGPERISRFEFASLIAAKFDFRADLLIPVSTAQLGQTAPRPLSAGLTSEKLDWFLPPLMRTISSSLEDCAAEIQAYITAPKASRN